MKFTIRQVTAACSHLAVISSISPSLFLLIDDPCADMISQVERTTIMSTDRLQKDMRTRKLSTQTINRKGNAQCEQ